MHLRVDKLTNDRLLINRVPCFDTTSLRRYATDRAYNYYERNNYSTDLFISSFMIRSPASIQPSRIPGPRIFKKVPLEMT